MGDMCQPRHMQFNLGNEPCWGFDLPFSILYLNSRVPSSTSGGCLVLDPLPKPLKPLGGISVHPYTFLKLEP
jgi:hypothetical protein